MSAPEVIVPNNDDPTSENAESSVSSDSPLNTCCVCLEGLHRDDTATITSCHHKLHSHCLSAMISFRAAQRQTSGSSLSNDPIDGIPCPLCRVSFDSYIDEHGERKAVTDLLANTGQWEMESPIPPPTFSPQQRIVPVGTRVTIHATGPGVIYYFSTNQFPVRYVLHRYTHPIRLRGLRTYIGATVVNGHRHSQVTTVCYETTLCGVRLSYCTLIIPILLIIACIIVFTIIAIQVR